MKLWKKISLICSAVLLVVVAACSFLLLRQTRRKILSLTSAQVCTEHKGLASGFEEMVKLYRDDADTPLVEHSLVQFCFSRFAGPNDILMCGGETLYANIRFSPEAYLPLGNTDTPQTFTGTVNGRHMLIVGSNVRLMSTNFPVCQVYTVEDITPVFEDFSRMLVRFALIGGTGIVLGMLMIVLLVRRAVEPLAQLQTAAAQIASGSYHQRAAVHTRDEVGQLARDFNCMAQAVERHVTELTRTAQRQQLFIGAVTHEFKTPLTALALSADTLRDTYLEEEEREALLTQMERQCRWLERLVQKLLKLLTLDQALDLRPTPVSELLEQVRQSVAPALGERGVGLCIRCDTALETLDADLMRSVLVNLVDNAGKASAPGQTVELCAQEHLFTVKDTGTGIPREELARITEPFYMVDKSRSKKQGGVGLGLALVQRIVDAHGAVLEFESTPGEGTLVRVRLQR